MKFLTISTNKEAMSALPPAMVRQLLEASTAWVNQQKQAGVIKEIYWIPGLGTAVICEHESTEHLVQTLTTLPLGPFMNLDVHPLADFNESMKAHIEAAKKAEQLFPPK